MTDLKRYMPTVSLGAHIVFIMVWLSNLAGTDAYFSVYVIIAFGAFFCTLANFRKDGAEKYRFKASLFAWAAIFSALVLFANYEIFPQVRDPERVQYSTNLLVNCINATLSFIGGIFTAYPILCWVWEKLPLQKELTPRSDRNRAFYRFVIGVFVIIAAIDLVHLFLVEYPGNVTEDPFSQIAEMCSGEYSNFNSFWHTMILQALLTVGYGIFGEINAAVAFYCVCQLLIVAAAFTYCLSTLYLAGLPKPFLFATFLVYAILPYQIALSITIWKDVLFAAGGLLMAAALLRILKNLGSRKIWNYVVFVLGGLLFSLSRSNGWYVYLVTLLVFLIVLRKQKKVLAVMAVVFAFCWVLSGPVLSLLGVSGTDYTEALSLPLQQVSRVIADGCELTKEETELISQVLDIEEVPQLYTSWLSDPIKVEFRSNNVEFFAENVGDYVKLWVRLGLKYPGEYFKAWVDQTKGYWNGGYNYAMYSETVTDNPYGVEKAGQSNLIAKLFGIYFGLSRHVIFLEPLHSIGLHVWIAALCCVLNAAKKREEGCLAVPSLIVILGLILGTPVYCSFRYAYPLFAVFPLIVGTTVYPVKKQEISK